MFSRLENFRSPPALLCFFGVAAAGVAIDLWSKSAAVASLQFGRVVRFIPGVLHFEYTRNFGAVFGLGQGQKVLFVIVSILAIGFLTYLFASSGRARIYQIILGMLLAGVLGNMYDRLRFGYVRDMLHGLPGWYWPAWLARVLPDAWHQPEGVPVFPWIFNVADSLLCIGVAAMILFSFFTERRKRREAPAPPGPPDSTPTEAR
jgi:signal peptidase II